MSISTTEQEVAEYREQIKVLIEAVDILSSSNMAPKVVEALITSAHWTLDKHPQGGEGGIL